ncbi:phenylalanyl-tRNA synthetase subunit beta [Mycoplasma wenyonii str. Massachusetts]|uniref:Phenylalanyl-tRNA synthetase subunit beta n=1 Tax=Mycoplasma wenyonii (strain Massachusetts) TaxID=1197325 RepID=I6ZIS0_MYCWM|nr:phenylalanyl-tRNA synthetase subunit beta [Mycoplasma wenyonii]AFN65095.1 phenylalanyl-tRNA synthetase subunit beta [Mycoplasma wenyonii str. Massachusetts]
MLLSDSLLHFFLPDLKKANLEELEAYLTSIQLEIVESWESPIKSPHPIKVLSASLADEQKYRYELCSLRTGNIFYTYSNLSELDINKVVFISKQSIPDGSVIEDREFLAFSDIFREKGSRSPKVTPISIDSTDPHFKEWLEFNFFFPTKFYRLKQIYKYCDFSTSWAVSQELSLPANIVPKKFENQTIEELFPESSSSNLLVSIFLQVLQLKTAPSYKEKLTLLLPYLFGEYQNYIFTPAGSKPRSKLTTQIKLRKLLPIFSELKEDWEEKVVKRLSQSHFTLKLSSFSVKKKDEWEVFWPPWYSTNTLPPISELLVKLIPLDQSPKKLGSSSSDNSLRECNSVELASETRQLTKLLTQLRTYLREKGFVECNSVKFTERESNFKSPSIVLTSNKEVSLRDNLHLSLTKVLLENLNQSNELYPIFELSYCPWTSVWKLGLAVITNFVKKEENSYNLFSLKKLVSELVSQLLGKEITFKEIPLEERYMPSWKASKIYSLVHIFETQEINVGEFLVFRDEQLELRKKELLSLNLNIWIEKTEK